MSESPAATPSFRELSLSEPVLTALDAIGYESPSPIQAATIPMLIEGRDVLGQAQTGTGKTAAFALPILTLLNPGLARPQALVLAPTRELAIQVAEAFQKYAAHIPNFHVLPIYGGQSYEPQLRALRRGVHVVVGTPGRVVDHLKRGTLQLDHLRQLVLDEADEMLRMGFIEDVEWVLQQLPEQRQVALFSATMPPPIRRIAQTYLKDPAEVTIAAKTTTAANIRQRYWLVSGLSKLDALTRILEAETFDAMIVFSRTKLAAAELAEKLAARGYSAAALHGDIAQRDRERTVARLRDGSVDIVVATDVAARGLDVERISHVVNFDIPTDTESYVHRIGRTGRAGRSGEAILFVMPRERHLLKMIERATRQPVAPMPLPTLEAIQDQRNARFKRSIAETLTAGDLDAQRQLVAELEQELGISALEIAAALARMAQGGSPSARRDGTDSAPTAPAPASRKTFAEGPMRDAPARAPAPAATKAEPASPRKADFSPVASPFATNEPRRPSRDARDASEPTERRERAERVERPERIERVQRPEREAPSDEGLETYRLDVGLQHGVKPGNIVGAIANEAGLDSAHIGRVRIYDDHSLVDLPEGMPRAIFRHLQKVWVAGRQLNLRRMDAAAGDEAPAVQPPPRHPKKGHAPREESTPRGAKPASPKARFDARGKPGERLGRPIGKPRPGGGKHKPRRSF